MTESDEKGRGFKGAEVITAAAMALVGLAVYAKTTCPGSYWQDAGIYVRAAYLLGNCYPPGYPTYLPLAALFSAFPGMGPVGGINLFSAVAGAAAAFFCALTAWRLAPSAASAPAAAATATLLLIAAPGVWSQAVAAEVYTLNLALTAATWWALLRWGEGRDDRFFLLGVLIYGLACGVHPQQFIFFPAYVAYVIAAGGGRKRSVASWALAAAVLVLASSAYVYLPLRSAQGILPDWGRPKNLPAFWDHVTGRQYRQDLFTASAALIGERARAAAALLREQFPWAALAVAVVGGAWLGGRRPRSALLIFGAAGLAVAFILNYYSANWRTYYLPLYFTVALSAGVAVAVVTSALARRSAVAGGVAAAAAVVLAAALIPARWGPADRSGSRYADVSAANILRLVGPRATFILSYEGSAVTGPVATLVTTSFSRPDIFFIDGGGSRQFKDFFDFVGLDVREEGGTEGRQRYVDAFVSVAADPERSTYVLFPFAPARSYGYRYEKRAQLWRVLRPGEVEDGRDWWRYYRRGSWEAAPPAYLDYWSETYLASTYVNEWRDRRMAGDKRRAEVCLALAEDFGARSAEGQLLLGMAAREEKRYDAALAHFARAKKLDPTLEKPRGELIKTYEALGMTDKARQEENRLRQLWGQAGPGGD